MEINHSFTEWFFNKISKMAKKEKVEKKEKKEQDFADYGDFIAWKKEQEGKK